MPGAKQARRDVWEYIAKDNPYAALEMDDLFDEAATRLGAHPNSGFSSDILGTRELVVHANYRLIYQVEADTIWILALMHTARHWPPLRK